MTCPQHPGSIPSTAHGCLRCFWAERITPERPQTSHVLQPSKALAAKIHGQQTVNAGKAAKKRLARAAAALVGVLVLGCAEGHVPSCPAQPRNDCVGLAATPTDAGPVAHIYVYPVGTPCGDGGTCGSDGRCNAGVLLVTDGGLR